MATSEISYRWMEPDEVSKLKDIDRSEKIRINYKYVEGELQARDVDWDTPAWFTEGDGEHTVASHIRFCKEHLARNGRMCGAFHDQKLVGVGIIQPDVAAGTAQLAYLHVSNRYRQKGIGNQIVAMLIDEARRSGAAKLYVSATPSGSAVNFYQSQGFRPTAAPIRELFELEPDDIHMLMEL
ncbi:MAG: GNAT family N-acetyltransferase [Ardenticatenaceae bacterium]|nr:GNAT family N-acetyltransferase [Ardenticatenaceae bacterium]